MRRRFFWRNMFATLIPVLVAILALGSLLFFVAFQYIAAQVNQASNNLLLQASSNMENQFEQIETIHTVLNSSPLFGFRLRRFLGEADDGVNPDNYEMLNNASNLLNAMANSDSNLLSIYIYYNNSRYFMTTTNKVANLDYYYDNTWHDDLKGDDINHSTWCRSRRIHSSESNRLAIDVLTLYKRMTSGRTTQSGVIIYNLKTQSVNQMLNSLLPSADFRVVVLDDSLKPVFASDSAIFDLISAYDGEIPSDAATSDGARVSVNGEDYVAYLSPSRHYGFQYLVLRDPGTMRELPAAMLKSILIVVFFSVFFSFVASAVNARRTSRKLYEIMDLLESSTQSRPLPEMKTAKGDLYSTIISNMICLHLKQERMRTQLTEYELDIQALNMQALRNQINPHFLYNTLQTLYWNAIGPGGMPNESSEMIASLTDILKYVFRGSGMSVELDDEIRMVQNYLDIQSIRFSDRFNVFWGIPAEIRKLHVIRLIIQPLVENCIVHGLSEKVTQINIRIDAAIEAGNLLITVVDDGAGMTEARLSELRTALTNPETWHHDSLGLLNTHKRIRLTFGEAYGVHIDSRLGGPTRICLVMPVCKQSFDTQKPHPQEDAKWSGGVEPM